MLVALKHTQTKQVEKCCGIKTEREKQNHKKQTDRQTTDRQTYYVRACVCLSVCLCERAHVCVYVSLTVMTVDLCMAYMLMLIPVTLTLMQGHSGSAKQHKNQR